MRELRLEPLQTPDAAEYWRVYAAGRSDLPSASVKDHLDRYLSLPPEERRTHFAFRMDGRIVGTARIITGTSASSEASLSGFALDPAHSGLAPAAVVKSIDLLRAGGARGIVASFEERYAPAFAAAGFRPWFARMRMEAPAERRPVERAGLRPPEEPEVLGLASFLRDAYEGHMEQAFGMHVGAESDWRDYVAAIFKGEAGAFLPDASFVSMDGERIVGAILATHWMGAPLVAELGVARERRGQGLGRALVQASMNRLAERGESRVALYVTLGNDPAIALYRRLGFVPVGGQAITARLAMEDSQP